MRKTLVVAVREYQASVRTKAFLITLVAMPILMGGTITAQILLKDKVDLTDRKIAILDASGRLYNAVEDTARNYNENEIYEDDDGGRKQVQPRFLVERFTPSSDNLDQARFYLSERVRAEELFAFALIPEGVIDPAGEAEGPPIVYHSNSPTYRDLRRWLTRTVNDEIQRLRLEQVGVDPRIVKQASAPVAVEDRLLVSRDETGAITEAEVTNKAVNFGVPVGMMMLMLMVVMVGASPLVNSVLEEKMQRIAEVLLGSIPPFQLMMGKLLGTVGVALTISTVYLVGAYIALDRAGYASIFPTHLVWWFALYQALAVLLYGSVFVAVGAAVTDIKESQSMLMPVMVLIMAPFFVWVHVLEAPTSSFSVIVSLVPPATPMLMLLRQAIPPGVPLWQPLVGIVGVILTTAVFVFASGRVFRVGILMQGKGAKFSQLVRWAIRG